MVHSKSAAVIGAGIAGIATAIRLANKGFRTEVFEANDYPGGKLSEFERDGYRFDAGPSLFTMPQLVDELFRLSGKDPAAYFEYLRLPETCRYFYEDGTRLTAPGNPEAFAGEIERATGEPAQRVLDFLADSRAKYDLTADVFLHRSLHKAATYLNANALRGYLNFHKLDAFRTMNAANTKRFRDPRVVQLFNRYATYNGSDPYRTPATMNIIPHLEYNVGAYFPKRGMVDITRSLVTLAEEVGVTFHYGAGVREIVTERGKAVGLRMDDQTRPFDRVVSNVDVVNTYRKLLPRATPPAKLLSQPKSSSALIFYWGIRSQFAELGLHNIFFSRDYRTEFDHLFQRKDIADDPTVYLNITTKHKPDDAPEGCENWFAMINAPNNSGQDWDALIARTRVNVLAKLSRLLGRDVAPLVACESILDPRRIESRTSSSQGALYGNSSNNRYAAFLRHANFSSRIGNLYFCGGSVHPGGGIPLCLLSAKITADLVKV
ncbi:MAG: phytoene desaturase [Ferruginibacter sp.]|nr:phytoene desaturase [Cytophagales bacterium]